MMYDVLCFVSILFVPFAIAGLSLLNTGLGRSRSAAQAMASSVCVVGVAVLVYFIFGFAVEGPRPIAAASGLNTSAGLFLKGMHWDSPAAFSFLLGTFSVALAAVIPLGATADRWHLGAACASTVVLAGLAHPLFIRCISTLDLLAGVTPTFPVFLDSGGAASIQVVGGLNALALAWLLGPRLGKYSHSGMPAAIPAHNGVFVLFGCMLAWIGWLGLNLAGAIVYSGIKLQSTVLVAVNTTLTAVAAGLSAAVVTRVRFRKPDASLIANAWMAGLVASSAGCASLKPAISILVGMVAGALVVLSVEFFEFTLKVDDPCGSVSVHAAGGLWGLLAAGIFAGGAGQLISQLVGIATLLGLVFPLSYGLNWLLGRFIPHRVSLDGERQGLDLHELGADAYPEFVVHADEFMQR
jgi:ammonium transporter, Amt family